MYKPNGEEPMTRQEELSRKAAIAQRKEMRTSEGLSPETLRSAFYSALFRSSDTRRESVEASLEIAR